MTASDGLRPRKSLPLMGAFAAISAVLVLLVGGIALVLIDRAHWHVAVPPAAFAAAMGTAGLGLARRYPHGSLGACNVVTQARAAMISLLVLPLLRPEAAAQWPWLFPGIAVAALALDGVDGWLARRAGLASEFGARFDMEVDAALAALLALLLMGRFDGAVHAVALPILGFSRYAFVLASWLLPWLRAPLPERSTRKAVCVAQIGALIGVLALPALAPVLPVVAAALLWSFGRDIAWLRRRAA